MASTNEKKIYMAAGVLVAALGGLWLTQKRAQEDAVVHSHAAVNLPDLKLSGEDADKVTKLEIKNGTKATVTLQKDGDTWKVTSPVLSPANQQNVKSVIDNLKELRAKDIIDNGKGQYGTYDLNDDKAVHVTAFKGADKALDVFFGKSGSRGQMLRLADKDGVYVATGYSSYQYTRELKEWRDREVLKFEDSNVVSVLITKGKTSLSFSKNDDKWSATINSKPLSDFDPEKVKDMLRSFKALTADDFGDGKAASETGLESPEASVTIVLKDNAGTYKLNIGNTVSGSNRYAQKDGSPTVYTLTSWAADWVTTGESKFQKTEAKDAGAAKPAAKAGK